MATKKEKRVMLDMEDGRKQVLDVKGDFDIHENLEYTGTKDSWVIIPTKTGGYFCVRCGLVLAISVEDADVVARAA